MKKDEIADLTDRDSNQFESEVNTSDLTQPQCQDAADGRATRRRRSSLDSMVQELTRSGGNPSAITKEKKSEARRKRSSLDSLLQEGTRSVNNPLTPESSLSQCTRRMGSLDLIVQELSDSDLLGEGRKHSDPTPSHADRCSYENGMLGGLAENDGDSHSRAADLEGSLSEMLYREDPAAVAARIMSVLRKTTLVLEVTQLLAESQSLEALLQNLTGTVVSKLGVERCTIFLHDARTDELYTRASEDETMKEIRFPSNAGIAGRAFKERSSIIIEDAYSDPSFNKDIDRKTGFRTRSILCTPIWMSGEGGEDALVIGVTQAVNKVGGVFSEFDLSLMENMMTPAAQALVNARLREDNDRVKNIMIEISQAMSFHQSLDELLPRLTSIIVKFLGVERCTIFLHDTKTDELYLRSSQDKNMKEIRFPSRAGIAGQAFSDQAPLVVPDAYADARFNKEIDRQTGFCTRSILCAPIWKAATEGEERTVIGVAQAVNKKDGEFTDFDLNLLENMTTQAAHALVNAQLTDEVIRVKNYNERMLESIRDGILSVDPDGVIVKLNRAIAEMLHVDGGRGQLVGLKSANVFTRENAWIEEGIQSVAASGASEMYVDRKLQPKAHVVLDVNVSIVPLTDPKGSQIGCIVQIEDVSKEKRMRSTLSRYMSPKVAEKLLDEGGDEVLGGKLHCATVLFSDIRGFTSISERLGPGKTVKMLNEYFHVMTGIVFDHDGSLDKFIGDAIMAVYGVPFEGEDDADNAVLSAIKMQREMAAFNASRKARDIDELKIGIGINTGEVVSGNIGSLKRMEYTSIGDAVNLSARLESACKTFQADILVSEFTVLRLRGNYVLREVDRIRVKGKTQPVAIYEVLDHLVDTDSTISGTMSLYSKALTLYREGNFAEASAHFAEVIRIRPNDATSNILLARCQRLIRSPPLTGWGGVWTMESK